MAPRTLSTLRVSERRNWEARAYRLRDTWGITPEHFAKLCTLQNRLHAWAEEECNGTIQREDPTESCPFPRPRRWYEMPNGEHRPGPYIADGEVFALAQAKRVISEYPYLALYHQSDPRGCSLYIYRSADLPEGEDISCYYSRVGVPCYFA